MKMNNRSKGFSLLELLVVMGIVGVLAAIAIPSYKQFTDKADIADSSAILVSINLEIVQNKLNKFTGNVSKSDIKTIIKNTVNGNKNVSKKFDIDVTCSGSTGTSCTNYYLYAKPKKGVDLKKGLWLSSMDATLYTCDSSVDLKSLKDASKNKMCTK